MPLHASAGLLGILPGLTIARNELIEKVREIESECGWPDSLESYPPRIRRGRPPKRENTLLGFHAPGRRRGRPPGSKNKVKSTRQFTPEGNANRKAGLERYWKKKKRLERAAGKGIGRPPGNAKAQLLNGAAV